MKLVQETGEDMKQTAMKAPIISEKLLVGHLKLLNLTIIVLRGPLCVEKIEKTKLPNK